MIDNDFELISDEALAAYLDGNATAEETGMIELFGAADPLIQETIDVFNDNVTYPINEEIFDSFFTVAGSDTDIFSDACTYADADYADLSADDIDPAIDSFDNPADGLPPVDDSFDGLNGYDGTDGSLDTTDYSQF